MQKSPKGRPAGWVLLLLGCDPAIAADASVDATHDAAEVSPADVTADLSLDVVADVVSADVSPDRSPDVSSDRGAPDVSLDGAVADLPPAVDAPSVDVLRVDPLAPLASCLGVSEPITVSNQLPYLSVPVGAQRGEFLLDYGSSFSSIDLRAFPPPGPSTEGCDRAALGVTCTVAGFAFFAPPGPVRLVTADYAGVEGPVRQAGILGTDFTSLRATALSYTGRTLWAAGSSGCADDRWRGAGFVPLSSAGFFSNDLSSLRLRSTVDATAAPGVRVPNIPTVPVRVAGVSAVAQLDTGFDDALVPYSVNINPAFLDAITAADAGALVRASGRDLSLTTCVPGVRESVEAYTLGAGRSFAFVDTAGTSARGFAETTLFVKRTPAAARPCGGIGTWTVPAAQVAGSFFVAFGAMAFDPFTSRVWVPTR